MHQYTFYIIAVLSILLLAFFYFIVRRLLVVRGINIEARFDNIEKNTERTEKLIMDQLLANRNEISTRLNEFGVLVSKFVSDQSAIQNSRLDSIARNLDVKLEGIQTKVDNKLTAIQNENSLKLEEMRKVVEEKLQGTLDRRLGESFKQVAERLEQVHKGLGEMQELARGVGDLKKVLTNVKTRGVWGEIQLEALLDQILTIDQFSKNVRVNPDSSETVEFAIKLPGKEDEHKCVWLPIDAKFPREDYERLIECAEKGDADGVALSAQEIEKRIKEEARTINKKYIHPPHTTDFAILFLPVEGLYSEVLRRPGLFEFVQKEYRVNITGPTTLAALLNSLQMGFRTLAIEKRSSEVWKLLSAVKMEFEKFEEIINKIHQKIQEVDRTIEEDVARRTRVISKKLSNVETLPSHNFNLDEE